MTCYTYFPTPSRHAQTSNPYCSCALVYGTLLPHAITTTHHMLKPKIYCSCALLYARTSPCCLLCKCTAECSRERDPPCILHSAFSPVDVPPAPVHLPPHPILSRGGGGGHEGSYLKYSHGVLEPRGTWTTPVPNNRDERVSCVYANTPRAWCKYIWVVLSIFFSELL